MKTYKVKIVEFSPQLEDGSRKTLGETVIASCKKRGDAEEIAQLLRTNTLEWCYSEKFNTPDANMYRITVEQ